MGCKKKQENLLKSGKWLNNPALSEAKKKYTSDYILSKAAEVGLGMIDEPDNFHKQPTPAANAVKSELTNLVNSIDQNFKGRKSLPSVPVQANGGARKLPVPGGGGGRQLPQVNPNNNSGNNKSQVDKVKYDTYIQTSNSAQSVPELGRDNELFLNNNCSNNNATRIGESHYNNSNHHINSSYRDDSEDTNEDSTKPDDGQGLANPSSPTR